jgi:hypothetical protein
MNKVLIQGESVAACCCASLLDRAGVSHGRVRLARPKLPAIMIGETAQRILEDIFPDAALFEGMPRISKRVVKWGAAQAVALPHSAIVAAEETLLERMEGVLLTEIESAGETAEWRILSARPLPEGAADLHFGERIAESAAVRLKPGYDTAASWVESLENGWLFLLPNGTGDEQGWLLSVGGASEDLLGESSLIGRQILSVGGEGRRFACHPRIAEPLCGMGWLGCGGAALGFDPLCGDGSGYAAREAILAAAVVRAAVDGWGADELLAHYQTRLVAGFQKHLEVCAGFYRSGHRGKWWEDQRSATEKGLTWCQGKLATAGEFQFRLNGFSLEARFPSQSGMPL